MYSLLIFTSCGIYFTADHVVILFFIWGTVSANLNSYFLPAKTTQEKKDYYAAIDGIAVVVACLSAVVVVWCKNIVSSLSQMVEAFIRISAATILFDAKRKITSSSVNESSLIILRRSNLGVCNSSIFLGRVNSMRLGLVLPLKSLLLWCSGSSLYTTV